MPESPQDNTSEVLDLALYSNGSQLDAAIGVASITITNAVNRIPSARIELHDGNMPEQNFPLSDGNDFDPGKTIKIEAGYGSQKTAIFEGVVVKHSIRIDGSNDARLVVECRDKAVQLSVGRRNASYLGKTDGEIITQMLKKPELSASVASTSVTHPELVQYYCSDWDFILSRAEVNGMLVITDSGKVSVQKPATSGDAVLKVTYGDDLLEMQADIDARSQYASVDSANWDPATQQVVTARAAPQSMGLQGDLDSKTLSEVLMLASYQLQTPAELDEGEVKAWAEAQQVRSGLARVRGRLKFQGSALAKPGILIEVAGVGDHFNGKAFVGSVTHRIEDGNWTTEAAIGLAPDWFAERRDLMAPPASGLLPGIDGLQIAKVVKINADPDTAYRIQINLPLLDPTAETAVWARLASFYASAEVGAFFLPEVGDEVLVGFLNDDPTQPIVLGSLFSVQHAAPYEASETNDIKAIVTCSQMRIEFDDKNKITTIVTPGSNQDTKDLSKDGYNRLVLNDQKKSILLQDQAGNKLELSQDGITLDSPKDITIKAGGKIDITATGAINVSSNADVAVKGMNVDCEAQTGFTAKGNASAELSASGNTTVKGAMVMIN